MGLAWRAIGGTSRVSVLEFHRWLRYDGVSYREVALTE